MRGCHSEATNGTFEEPLRPLLHHIVLFVQFSACTASSDRLGLRVLIWASHYIADPPLLL